ncbi:hypothetical protein DMENIID0001_155620 [Sergentomyia squamirostris]
MDEEEDKKKQRPSGILRLDINKPRRSSGGSVEFRSQPELLGENAGFKKQPRKTRFPGSSLTYIAEGSCSKDDTSLTIHQSLLNVTNFASSAPRNSRPSPKASSRVVISPIIVSVDAEEQGLNNPPKKRLFKKTSDSFSSVSSGSSTTAFTAA